MELNDFRIKAGTGCTLDFNSLKRGPDNDLFSYLLISGQVGRKEKPCNSKRQGHCAVCGNGILHVSLHISIN
jgi:hypothetical protein